MTRKSVLFNWKKASATGLHTVVLAALFVFGILLGITASQHASHSTSQELLYYFAGYYQLKQSDHSFELLLYSFISYFRYPTLAVLFGFSSLGIIAIPVITITFGFLLAFSVSCLTITFGDKGPLLAGSIFGLRSAVTIFCFFLLAVPGLGTAISLANLSFGMRRHSVPINYGREWLRRIGFCAVLLMVVLCIDFWLSPNLLEQILGRIL